MKHCSIGKHMVAIDLMAQSHGIPRGYCKACHRIKQREYEARKPKVIKERPEKPASSQMLTDLLNALPVFTRGNLSPRVCWELAA